MLEVVQDGKEVYRSKRLCYRRSRCLVEMWTLVTDECLDPRFDHLRVLNCRLEARGRRGPDAGRVSMCISCISVLGRISELSLMSATQRSLFPCPIYRHLSGFALSSRGNFEEKIGTEKRV